MTDARPAADPPDPQRTQRMVQSIVAGLRARLEGEGRAGLVAVRRASPEELGRAAAAKPQGAESAAGTAPAGEREHPAAPAAAPEAAADRPAPGMAMGESAGEGPAASPETQAADRPATGPAPAAAASAPPSEAQAAAALRQELAQQVHVAARTLDLFQFGSAEDEGGAGREESLARIAAEVAACDRCKELAAGRTHTVPGQGDPRTRLVFIGEGPGEEEDRQGLAFVGRAGELLTKMIEAIGLTRDQVFICNILKCRPPANRAPMPDEAANCTPYLMRQLEVLRPQVICALGGTAAKWLLQTHDGITRLRGRFYPYRGVQLMPTFHPAYVLRNYTPDTRKKVYEDLLKVRAAIDAAT
ncbi:MAG: uracil-DNA glycosylase [Planctomycetes bacterium]|nr:uracil-DNA glycosylase [Planctomycetota bacterium]